MFKIMRLVKSQDGTIIKKWFDVSREDWTEDFFLGLTFRDINECLDVLRELRHDLNEPLYIAIMQD